MAAEPLAAATYSQQASVVVPAASAPHRSLSMDSHHHPFDSSALAASFRQRANAKLLIPLKHKDYLRYIFMTSLWQRLASEPRPRRPFAHRRGAKHATCSRVNASAQALHRSRMLATADYLAGGLPRACLASKLPMPSGAQRESEWDKAVRNGHNQSPLNEGNSAKVMSETAAERESDLKSSCMEEGGDNPLPCPFNDRSAAASTAARSLEKARLIQATSSGLFCVLPLGFRVLKKIETVCHEELAGTGASPLSLPSLMPMEWLHDSDVRTVCTVTSNAAAYPHSGRTTENGALHLRNSWTELQHAPFRSIVHANGVPLNATRIFVVTFLRSECTRSAHLSTRSKTVVLGISSCPLPLRKQPRGWPHTSSEVTKNCL